MESLSAARLIAILMPTALLGGAIGSQYLGKLVPYLGRLYPCEMCLWQRWPHLAAIVLALTAIALRDMKSSSLVLTALAALGVVVSGTWGMYHDGVAFWPWVAAALLILSALVARGPSMSRRLTALAALAIATSGAIGIYHAGVEYHWWEGATGCTALPGQGGGGDALAQIMAAPVIRCDVAQWTKFGISLAGFNAIFSLGAALAILSAAAQAAGVTRETQSTQMLRVDQAGEYGATRIYAGQLAVMGDRHPAARSIAGMAAQEERHRQAFDAMMAARGVRPTLLQPLWNVAGFALGAATAAIGPEAAMACTAAIETEIDRHYSKQLTELKDSDPELKQAISDFQIEEIAHRDAALAAGAERAPAYPILSGAIRLGCRLAIGLSKRI